MPASDGSLASVLVEYKFGGVPMPPFSNTPPDRATDTHECIKDTKSAIQQVVTFFEDSKYVNDCSGVRDGVSGVCTVDVCPWHGWAKQVASAGQDSDDFF